MIPHRIKIEASVVRTETRICPGMAKTKQGEVYVADARTPAGSQGICCQAFAAMSPFRGAMMVTDRLESETDGGLQITCPHGAVTYRLSREE
jgi:hypothetical protein